MDLQLRADLGARFLQAQPHSAAASDTIASHVRPTRKRVEQLPTVEVRARLLLGEAYTKHATTQRTARGTQHASSDPCKCASVNVRMVADDRVPSDMVRIALSSRKHRMLEYLRLTADRITAVCGTLCAAHQAPLRQDSSDTQSVRGSSLGGSVPEGEGGGGGGGGGMHA